MTLFNNTINYALDSGLLFEDATMDNQQETKKINKLNKKKTK